MTRVEIVIPILKNCLVDHDRFKRHILFLELKTVEKIRLSRNQEDCIFLLLNRFIFSDHS